MAKILSGTIARDALVETLAKKIIELHIKPTLVILQVGSRPDSDAYIRQKKLLAEKIGAVVIHRQFRETISEQELLQEIEIDNADTSVHGIILQIPIPKHLSKEKLLAAINPEKDVDGLVPKTPFTPATARGVLSLCDFYNIELANKKVTVIGKSALVGAPVARALQQRGAQVTVCDKQTGDLIPFTKPAEIIVVAAGAPKLITKDHVSPGQTIIDIGITETILEDKRMLVGDVDFKNVEPIVAAISPVPGGAGPMTVISLFENLVESATKTR